MDRQSQKPVMGQLTKPERQARAVEAAREAVKRSAKASSKANHFVHEDGWKRETHTLPRKQARDFAKAFLRRYPKAAYWSEVESWRVLENDVIEFTMRRLASAD